MAAPKWSLTAKICGSCKTSSAAVFCNADSAFLCIACDAKVHAVNVLASRHARVWLCEVCEQAPSSVTCKADAAALCASCDHDIHSANPLARRHERVPVAPFYGAVDKSSSEEEEAEAESWLIPNLNTDNGGVDLEEDSGSPEYKSAEYLFRDMDPYLDLDLFSGEQKQHQHQQLLSPDGVVPDHTKNKFGSGQYPSGPVVDGFPAYEMDYPGPKHIMYNFTSQSISHSVSSSSLDAGVVPEHHVTAEVSNGFENSEIAPTPLSGVDREARVLRYREKRKNRRFEKTIRYASRKAYAETRPRIKGRFAKRSELEIESFVALEASYGVVPSF
ncbi:zinc finger protein CONSTANS-LIKE 4-like [Dorcoceras hygrometricum]|uniref:Zinc finger protein CONSTANS-LIKE 4-like n=1 Tax=Dorcoceras hygrometricum TaxID=472368 RepID=A0A2Z7C5U3_9LAMI|nr:zinc finger protein CONSTANS-LIKE 4-like [Dorcoceras hygrometricum]